MRYMSIGLKRQVNVEEELLGRVVNAQTTNTHIHQGVWCSGYIYGAY
jgi:hypothetical protein